MRRFISGATRNDETGKLDFEGSFHPLVLKRFAEYMRSHRGNPPRPDDNWKLGIPLDSYMKSGTRHFMDWWLEHSNCESREGLESALCGLLFNVQGYLLLVLLKNKKGGKK